MDRKAVRVVLASLAPSAAPRNQKLPIVGGTVTNVLDQIEKLLTTARPSTLLIR